MDIDPSGGCCSSKLVKSHQASPHPLFLWLPSPIVNPRPVKALPASPWTLECDQPCKTKQNSRENTSDEVMQSDFVVISHHYKYRSFFLFLFFFRGVTGKLKGITSPTVSSYFSLFVHVGKSSFSVRVKKWAFRVYPKAPERKWASPSVGNTVCLCLHYIPAAIESQSGTVPRVVSRISIQSTKKRIESKWMTGLVSPLRVWSLNCRFKG